MSDAKTIRSILATLILALTAGLPAWSPGTVRADDAAPDAPGTVHALLIGGMPGTDLHARRYRDWLTRMRSYLVETAGVPAGNVTVLSGDKPFVRDGNVAGALADKAGIERALASLVEAARPDDQAIVFLVGHGQNTGPAPTLLIPGEDLTSGRLAAGLEDLRARNQVVLNFSGSSGDFLEALAAPGRVNVAATPPGMVNEPVLAEFFLRALESKSADGEGAPDAGTKDDTVTLLEAYNHAAHQTAMWITRITGTWDHSSWSVRGRESVGIFRKLYGHDGGQPGGRTLKGAEGDVPDEPVNLRPPGGEVTEDWQFRRVLSEAATLEDTGDPSVATTCLLKGEGEKGYQPLTGRQAGSVGALARRVVLGRPALLDVEDGKDAPSR
jgi:hypothetical protein